MKVNPHLLIAASVTAMLGVFGCSSTRATKSLTAATAATAEIPENLKSDGYFYYGLNDSKPMNMEIQASTNTAIQTGTQTTKLKEVKDGKATYVVERTGNLGSLLGNMELSLEPDGVYVKSSTIAKVGSRDLEFPADVTAGKEWSTKTIVDAASQKMDVSNAYKIVGKEQVVTPVATYPEAIYVTSTGLGTMNGNKIRMETKGWYVKDRGMVKAVLTQTDPSGQKSVITIQESK